MQLKPSAYLGSLILVLGTIAFFFLQVVEIDLPKNNKPVKEILMHQIEPNKNKRDSIVDFSTQLLGTPYISGACDKKGFDCSGFVYFVFKNFNIKVPRSSTEFKSFGKEIPIEKVRKGDILVFLSPTKNIIGHEGIVSNPKGLESAFIHATSGKEMKVIISNLKQNGYRLRFVKAIDVL